jgi:thioredoxin reductase (NADPH)
MKAIERDLTKQYGNRFRVAQAESSQKALEIIKQLELSNDAVALFLADQRMVRRIAAGVGENSIAIQLIHHYLMNT